MTVKLDDYREFLAAVDPHVRDTLEASFAEAARVMSPRGLADYMNGAATLGSLGRGRDLVVSYLQAMPAVAKEVGETAVTDAVTHAMKLASMVSGEVIALVFATSPVAARRLGDGELYRQYLSLLHQLSSRAPRGLRPMLGRLDELFSRLTLGGLRRWALWGAQAHDRDYETLSRYFALETADSLAVLQRERRGTLFVDNQRKLNFYLRALWGRDFFLRPTSGDVETREGYRPYIEQRVIHLPDACDDLDAGGTDPALSGKSLYRAAATHAAAHLFYTRAPLSAEALSPAQMLLIGLFEDARIEALASRDFPGLKPLWLPFLAARAERAAGDLPAVVRLARLAHVLLSVTECDDPWICEAAAAFREEFTRRPDDNRLSWDLGVTFFNRLGPRGAIPPVSQLITTLTDYRDDNRYLWCFDEAAWREAEYVPASQRQVRREVNVMEMVNEIDTELAGDDAQEIWSLRSEFFRDGDAEGVSLNAMEGREPVSEPFHYDEWDYQVQFHRPDWVTVLEKRPVPGSAATIDEALASHRPLANRLKQIIDSVQPRGLARQRHQEDGDEIDIGAAIRALVDLRTGKSPDSRVNIRITRKTRDMAVLVLLDLSASINETPAGSDRPVLDLAREATALLAWSIDAIGDPFAIHGFASDGRHDVQYYRFKEFEQPYDDGAKARLAGMTGRYSTRMGAALRHAARHLRQRREQRKLLLLVTDGEPADIDVRDPQYLRHDTKQAVDELSREGITTFCLTLDARADEYVSRLFGARRYAIVDRVQRLPERLPALFMSLTR